MEALPGKKLLPPQEPRQRPPRRQERGNPWLKRSQSMKNMTFWKSSIFWKLKNMTFWKSSPDSDAGSRDDINVSGTGLHCLHVILTAPHKTTPVQKCLFNYYLRWREYFCDEMVNAYLFINCSLCNCICARPVVPVQQTFGLFQSFVRWILMIFLFSPQIL